MLVIDTAGARCAAAVFVGEACAAAESAPMARGHAEHLFPMIETALATAGLAAGDLDAIAVCTGPGGFTGARIGVAAARGMALATGARAVGVDRMEALAAGTAGAARAAVVLRDGRRAMRRFRDGRPLGPAALAASEAGEDAPDPAEAVLTEAETAAPALDALARAARLRLAEDSAPPRPAPLYLRPPDAAPPAAGPVPLSP